MSVNLQSASLEDDNMGKPVLVVDDEQNFLELLIRILGKRGFEVKTALSGYDALKLLDGESFELVLLDIRMGPMNGIQLLDEIKERQPSVKAIMMTAYPTSETRLQAFEKGASAYLTKPVDLQELLQTMDSLVPH
ncbi:MAG TPA: response regulator [Candidatus Binatia bacterium]|jgi:DNA-binding NtrC family response regulator|nr:response regulator [Candidatus Binatia bacterium]